MDKLQKLKILLQEAEYPDFTDEELNAFLNDNEENVYLTASELCLIKANKDSKITVGPITIESAGPDYWIKLSETYSIKANKSNNDTTSGYITRMKRC